METFYFFILLALIFFLEESQDYPEYHHSIPFQSPYYIQDITRYLQQRYLTSEITWSGSQTNNRIRTQLFDVEKTFKLYGLPLQFLWFNCWSGTTLLFTHHKIAGGKSFDAKKTTIKIWRNKKPVSNVLFVIE